MVDRKKIIHPKNLKNYHIEKLKISTVIIAIKDPFLENKQHLVDFCLENQIKVKTVQVSKIGMMGISLPNK